MQKTTEATHESPTTNPSSVWKLHDEVAELSDEMLMALWTAKCGGEYTRPYATQLSANETDMLSITLFLLQRGYVERQLDCNAAGQYVGQRYVPTDLGNGLLYGNN